MAVTETIYSFYKQTYGWKWVLENLRDSRKRMGSEVGFSYAERFQQVNLAAVEGLPACGAKVCVYSVNPLELGF